MQVKNSGVGGSAALGKPSLKLTHKVAIKLPDFGNNLRSVKDVCSDASYVAATGLPGCVSQFSPDKRICSWCGGTLLAIEYLKFQGQAWST